MHGYCVFYFAIIWTFRLSSYLLNSLLSLSQKVRLNYFLSRTHEDFPHTLIWFPFQLPDFFCVAFPLDDLCFWNCEIFNWILWWRFRYALFWSFLLLSLNIVTSSTIVWVSIRDLIVLLFSVNSLCKNAMFLWRASIFLFSWPSDVFVCSVKDSVWFLNI